MKMAINISPEIFAAITVAAQERGITASAVMRKALAAHFNLQDDFCPLVRRFPDPTKLADQIPRGANI